jgi:single-stranded DNA-binding protein
MRSIDMETSINQVTLPGMLSDVALRKTQTGLQVANAALLIVEGRDGKPARKQSIRLVAWERLADRLAELPKGAKVRVTGRIETISWHAKDSRRMVYSVQVVVASLQQVNHLADACEKVIAARPGPNSRAITPQYPAPQYAAGMALGGQG